MNNNKEEIVIDLNNPHLNESLFTHFRGAVKKLLRSLFGGKVDIPLKVKGSKRDVKSFKKALSNEKNYIDKMRQYGLDDPKTLRSKNKLKKAIRKFEKDTGIDWPFELD